MYSFLTSYSVALKKKTKFHCQTLVKVHIFSKHRKYSPLSRCTKKMSIVCNLSHTQKNSYLAPLQTVVFATALLDFDLVLVRQHDVQRGVRRFWRDRVAVFVQLLCLGYFLAKSFQLLICSTAIMNAHLPRSSFFCLFNKRICARMRFRFS